MITLLHGCNEYCRGAFLELDRNLWTLNLSPNPQVNLAKALREYDDLNVCKWQGFARRYFLSLDYLYQYESVGLSRSLKIFT